MAGNIATFEELIKPYSRDDLTVDEFYQPIQSYMKERFGVDELRQKSKEDVVEMYLNNMRGFAGGNSVRALNEVSFLNSADDKQKVAAGHAYQIFEDMEGIFSGETNWAEKGSAAWDYARGAVADPVNLVSFGVGKFAASGATKAASLAAQRAAIQTFKKTMATGVGKEVAEKAAAKTFGKSLEQVAIQQSAKMVANRATQSTLTTAAGKLTQRSAIKEIFGSAAVDSLAAIGTDYAYQKSMIRTDVQDEYNVYQSGLAALGGLVMGGIQAGGILMKGTSKLALPDVDVIEPSVAPVLPKLSRTIKEIAESSKWSEKIANGKELGDLDSQFWTDMLLGNEEIGVKGLTEVLLEEGFVYQKRGPDDKFSNWIADILKKADPEDATKFIENFENNTGISMSEAKALSIDDFADTFARKMSDQGKVLNAVSQAAKALGIKTNDVTISKMAKSMVGTAATNEPSDRFLSRLGTVGLGRFQNNVIRLIVSNTGTSHLNFIGWGSSTTMNSASDISMAALYSGRGFVSKYLMGNKADGVEAFRVARQLVAANKQKAMNLFDPDLTFDAFKSLAIKRPEAMRVLTDVMPGGIEDVSKLIRDAGFDPNRTMAGQVGEEMVDAIQFMSMVRAQDVYTKSQEMVYQMDKNLRISFDMGWSEFFNHPEAAKMMATKNYLDVESKSTYEVLRAIYSQSYKGPGTIGTFAGWIEDFRNVPGAGLLMPFGRFFNNTVAFMLDSSYISLIAKISGKESQRSSADLFARSTITVGAALTLAVKEQEYIEQGLAWDEFIGSAGDVRSLKYDFPIAPVKAAARIIAYHYSGKEVPPELTTQILDLLSGQLTRQIDDSVVGAGALLEMAMAGELEEISRKSAEVFGAVPSQIVSGMTRFADPINQLAAISRGDDYAPIDRKQGYRMANNMFRYVDQISALITGGGNTAERFSASHGSIPADPSKSLGTREKIAPTYLQKMMNFIGRPDFQLGSYSKSPEADNRYNQLYFQTMEERAEKLVLSEKFQKADLELKKLLVKRETELGRDAVYEFMRRDLVVNDPVYEKQLSIGQTNGWLAIDKALREMSEDLHQELVFEELSLDQLNMLEAYFKTRDDILLRRK